MTTKVTREFVIENKNGLHARPSASLVRKAGEFQSKIFIFNESGDLADGKSIMSVMCLCASQGSKLTVTAEGSDANEAIYALKNLFENKFGELN